MDANTTKLITATIDGSEVCVPEGSTILQAAKKAGIYIPTLCSLECLADYGGCRLCMVEVENMRGFPTACTTPLSSDMTITSTTDELQELRREILELLLSEHPYTCLICKEKGECSEYMHSTRKVSSITGCNFCPNNGACELQQLVEYLGLKEIRFPIVYRNLQPIKDNPFYTIDYNLCILCGRCVRICNEERYSEVLAFAHRGNATVVGTAFNESQKDAGCEFCGACVDVCPTASLTEKMGNWVGVPDASTTTHCPFCGIGCTMNVNTRGNRIVNVGPQPGKPENPPQLCVRGKFVPGDIPHHPARITYPHLKRNGHWVEATWEEALNFIAENLQLYGAERFGLIGSAHDSLENSFILQQFARQTLQSPNVDLHPAYGYSTVVRDIHDYYVAQGHATIDDILQADTVYVIGAQAHWSHPIIENRIRKAYKAGKEVIVANSTMTRTMNFSSDFRHYPKGGEHIFLHHLMEQLRAAKGHRRITMVIGDEIFHSSRVEENIQNVLRIGTSLGPDGRILFLLPEGNRYGATMAGMNPSLLPGFTAADEKGLSGSDMLKQQRMLSALYVVGDIPAGRHLTGLDFFVQHNMFFTPASRYAHVFLPLTTSMEEDGHILNLEGKLLPFNAVIPRADHILTSGEAVNKLARLLRGKPLYNEADKNTPDDSTSRQIHAMLDSALIEGRELKPGNTTPPDPRSQSKNSQLTRQLLKKYHFHYMGNSLPDVIPDLDEVLRQ
jgi:predicted molibdopterin-dependent oxidoreductase YjgC